jgi:uncharacterized protein YqeY
VFFSSIQNKIMSLQIQINEEIKNAMRAKDVLALEALRAIKSAILLSLTEGGSKEELTTEDEIKLLQRLVKQRKDSATIYIQQGRQDLADPEMSQAAIIEKFLPQQLSEADVEIAVNKIIEENGFSGMASMGQLMGLASKALAGQADGKTISNIVKKLLQA